MHCGMTWIDDLMFSLPTIPVLKAACWQLLSQKVQSIKQVTIAMTVDIAVALALLSLHRRTKRAFTSRDAIQWSLH